MSLLDAQRCFVRLVVDPTFRLAFFSDESAETHSYDLDETERSSLERLDQEALAAAGHMADLNRISRALRPFPLSARLLDGRLEALARAYSLSYPPLTISQERDDELGESVRILDFLRSLLDEHVGEEKWLLTPLLHFEETIARLQRRERYPRLFDRHDVVRGAEKTPLPPAAVLSGVPSVAKGVVVQSFEVDIQGVVESLRAGGQPDCTAFSGPTFVVFSHHPRANRVTTRRVGALVGVILRHCDGARSGHDIVALLAQRYSPDDESLSGKVQRAMGSLYERGLIVHRSPDTATVDVSACRGYVADCE